MSSKSLNDLPDLTKNELQFLNILWKSEEGYSIREEIISVDRLLKANEVFFSGTAAEIVSVGQINENSIMGGEMGNVTKQFMRLFFDIVHGKKEVYHHWLTVV